MCPVHHLFVTLDKRRSLRAYTRGLHHGMDTRSARRKLRNVRYSLLDAAHMRIIDPLPCQERLSLRSLYPQSLFRGSIVAFWSSATAYT